MLYGFGPFSDDCVDFTPLVPPRRERLSGQDGPITAGGARREARLLGEHKHCCTLIVG